MTSERKKLSVWKKLLIMLIIILLIFGGMNLAWYILKKRPYDKLAEQLSESGLFGDTHYELEKGSYHFVVKMPGYLGYEGGFCRVDEVSVETDINDTDAESQDEPVVSEISLYYWPGIFEKDDAFGLDMTVGNDFEMVFITEDLEYVVFEGESEAESEYYKGLLEDNIDRVRGLMDAAKSVWDF